MFAVNDKGSAQVHGAVDDYGDDYGDDHAGDVMNHERPR